MKKILVLFGVLLFVLAACAQGAAEAPAEVLKVTGPDVEKSYSVDDLRAAGEAQAGFKGVTYTGVPLSALLQDAGFDPANVKAVKAVAVDGFTANYEPGLFLKEDTLVAYAQADGPLSADDGSFRMVLPDQEGKMNVRQLVEIQVIQ